jgi:DNA-binding IclR family transcriptional regulator
MSDRGLPPSTKRLASDEAAAEPLYTAPALEKGLDILELLASESEGLAQGAIAQRLGRSAPELFRMLTVLQRRGYLERHADGCYRLSLRMFELSHQHPPLNRLLEVALPAMQELADATRQSCHLVVHFERRIVVVGQVDSPEPMGFRVRLGTHFPMRMDRGSPRVLTAFQPPATQEKLVAELLANSEQRIAPSRIRAELARVVERGMHCAPSGTAAGVMDLCAPIFNHHEGAIAALSVPFLPQKSVSVTVEEAARALLQTVTRISAQLGAGAGRLARTPSTAAAGVRSATRRGRRPASAPRPA